MLRDELPPGAVRCGRRFDRPYLLVYAFPYILFSLAMRTHLTFAGIVVAHTTHFSRGKRQLCLYWRFRATPTSIGKNKIITEP